MKKSTIKNNKYTKIVLFASTLCFLNAMEEQESFTYEIEEYADSNLTKKKIYDIDGYKINESDNSNKNHWDNRTQEIQHLVMHYTVGNLYNTLKTFTSDKQEGRVSSHYVISEKEHGGKFANIEGGELFEVVPEEKRAWHVGISS